MFIVVCFPSSFLKNAVQLGGHGEDGEPAGVGEADQLGADLHRPGLPALHQGDSGPVCSCFQGEGQVSQLHFRFLIVVVFPFLKQLQLGARRLWYGNDPKSSPDLCRIVNARHFARLSGLLAATKGKLEVGGQVDEEELYIAPTIITGVSPEEPVMQVCFSPSHSHSSLSLPGRNFRPHLPSYHGELQRRSNRIHQPERETFDNVHLQH